LFKPVQGKVAYPELEARILRYWEQHDTFQKSIANREGAPLFRFYEGPPTANGQPHVGHMLARALKDLFPRYRTMSGFQVPRKGGWDTHGLPVELEVEKQLGISGKPAIEEYGIAEFNAKSKESVWRYLADWEESTRRLGYWVGLDDAYVTYTNDYIESVWWALRQLWDRGLLYRGHKIVPYCPRCGTSLSSHEVAQGYAQAEDPSVYVRLPVADLFGARVDVPTSLLIWTTTPWTLPSNAAVAVNPAETYVLVELRHEDDRERMVLGKGCLGNVFGADAGDLYTAVAEFPGSALLGQKYTPPFGFVDAADVAPGPNAWTVLPADFVALDEGTGIVHMAPAFGEDDYVMGVRYKLPFFQPIDTAGQFTAAVADWQGQFVKDADPSITEDLKRRGLLLRADRYEHTYPFCWRCDSPLLYYARESWFVRTTAHKEQLIEYNQKINWLPGHLKDGRFGNFLDNLVDWNLSRERYWGSPLPIWTCDTEGCGTQHCIGSFAELAERATQPLADPFDPHRPFVDEIKLRCPKCGGTMTRVPHVIDCWFESGSMPFAQYHFPFENRETFERMFPADYICEAIDQTRGWFYSLHAIASIIFDSPAYLTCLCTEHVVDAEGLKMSKSRGNAPSPNSFFDKQGADALRWFIFAGSPPWTQKRVDPNAVTDGQNQVLDTLWNVYTFFMLYASIDGFNPAAGGAPDPAQRPALDRWMLSRLATVTTDVRQRMDTFDATGSARLLADLLDDLSNWYVRRGRKRYWKAEDDQDKVAAHWTLYEALVTTVKLLAPFVPFITEAVYQDLRQPGEPESVHLCDYPVAAAGVADPALETEMATCRRVVSLARAARNRAKIRTRQPLPELVVSGARLGPATESLLMDELNVKQVRYDEQAGSYVSYVVRLNFESVGPKLGRQTPLAAKSLAALEPGAVAALVAAGRPVTVNLAAGGDGAAAAEVELAPADILVRSQEREGFAVERDGGVQVALSTVVSEELLWEGLAREVVNRIQRARKEAGFAVADRIEAQLGADGALRQALAAHGAQVAREVLADAFVVGSPADVTAPTDEGDAATYHATLDVDGDTLVVRLRRIGS